jgi:hypothetical protein
MFEGLDEIFDAVVGEGDDFAIVGSIDPDHAVFGIHAEGKLVEQFDVLSEIGGDAINGGHAVHLVDVHSQAAWLWGVEEFGFQFHGKSSWIRLAGCMAMRDRTSASQAKGSIPQS